MGHLSTFERMKVIKIFNDYRQPGINKYDKVSELARQKGIEISGRGVRDIISKWLNTSIVFLFELN